MNMFTKIQGLYGKLVGWLDYGKPVVDLGLRQIGRASWRERV